MKKVQIKTNPEKVKSLVVGDKVFRSAYDHELSTEDLEQAGRQLKESQEVRASSLRTLKEMLAEDEFSYRLDDEYLLRFLRCRKFDCKEAYKMMHYLYSVSKDYPDTFATVPSNYQSLLHKRFFTFLPYRDAEGSIVILCRSGVFQPGKDTIYDNFHYLQPIVDLITSNPSCQINKIICIVDCKGFGMGHLAAALNPKTLWFWTYITQNFFPWRYKRIIFVNNKRLISILLNGLRNVMKKKIVERIVLTSCDMRELHEYLDPAILPKEYGGSLDFNEWDISEYVMDNLPYVEYEQSFR